MEGKDTPASIVEQISRRADDVGGYLERADADRMLGDVEEFARKRPWLVGAIALTAGFAASRFLKASSAKRYETYGATRYGATRYGDARGWPAGAAASGGMPPTADPALSGAGGRR